MRAGEFAVSKAEVIYKEDEKGKKLEPFEIAVIDVPDEFSGTVINMLNQRKGELQGMAPTEMVQRDWSSQFHPVD